MHQGGSLLPATPCISVLAATQHVCRSLWQVGNCLRIDGTLMGVDDTKQRSFIPRWKRGHFSLLVNAGVPPACHPGEVGGARDKECGVCG